MSRGSADHDGSELIDYSVAHAARMYDYLRGGTNNFAVDREAVERAAAAVGGIENARADVRANRAFLIRAVSYLAAEAGIRQFLDVGTGIPNGDNVHAVAQRAAPDSRIVYVDNDPIVLAHAHLLLQSSAEGATAYIQGDLREPKAILKHTVDTLDFTQPVALVLVAILHLIPDEDDPYGVVAELVDALPAGSHLVISHLTPDLQPEAMAQLAERLNEAARETFVMRDRAAFAGFFEGLEIIEPDWSRTSGLSPARTNAAALGDDTSIGTPWMAWPGPILVQSAIVIRGVQPLRSFSAWSMACSCSMSSWLVRLSNRLRLMPLGIVVSNLTFLAPKMSPVWAM
jgi:hypothetical protein